jgi:hypothetical protein
MKTLIFTLLLSVGSVCAQTNITAVSSGNWNNPATWNASTIPSQNDNVIIAAGTMVKMDSTAFCKNITIANGATLNADSGVVLGLSGNWNNCGSYQHGKGSVIFNGPAQQQIQGSASSIFYSLELNNAAGLNLASNVSIKHSLMLTHGTLDVSSYKLTLLSDNIETAFLAPINNGADINGKISVQRYMSSYSTGWRFLGSPVRTTLQDWSNDFVTSGFPGSTYPWFNFCSVYSYNETDTGSCVNGYIIPTGVTDSILPGNGYWCWIGPTPSTVEVSGYPGKFNQNFNLSLTPSAGKYEDGWNMLANPYPSAIDWDSPNWTKTGIQDAVYIWDPETEQYSTYINGIGINGGTNIIPSSRAFWVQANQNSPVLSCDEMVKTSSDISFQRPSTSGQLRLQLSGNGYNDETVIFFSNNSSAQVSSSEDAIKLYSDNPLVPSINSITDSLHLAVNCLPVSSTTLIPIKVKVGVSGTYTLELSQAYALFPSACIFIEDLVTSSYINVRNAFTYTFNISDTTSAPRFLLHVTKPLQKFSFGTTCSYKNDGMAIVNTTIGNVQSYTWKDMIGNTLSVHQGSNSQDTLKNLAAGIYYVQMQSNNSYCNSAVDQIAVTSADTLRTKVKTFSNTCINAASGKLVVTGVDGGTAPYTYKWSNGSTAGTIPNLGQGVYSLVVKDAKGCRDTSWHVVKTISVLKTSFVCDTVVNVNDPVVFTNSSVGAISSSWNFGDTTFSNAFSPVHFYTQPGTHTITLTSSDVNCTGNFQKVISVLGVSGINSMQASQPDEILIGSNGENAYVAFNLQSPASSSIAVYSADGKLVSAQTVSAWKNTEPVALSHLHGMYIIRVQANGKETAKKFIK